MAACLYEGQLMKKGKVNKAWKNRWVKILMQHGEIYLEYYDSKINNNLHGTIDISDIFGIQVVHFADYNLHFQNKIPEHIDVTDKIKLNQKYSFVIQTKERKYIFAAFDPKNFFKWLSMLHRFVYGGILKHGWLQKRGELNKQWKRRYFVLNSFKQIRYYQDELKAVYSGCICLNEVTGIANGDVIHGKDDNMYNFELITEKRIWHLSAHSLKERRLWRDLIEKLRRRDIDFDCKKQEIIFTDDEQTESENDVDKPEVMNNSLTLTDLSLSDKEDDDVIMDIDAEHIEQFQCTQCHKIYASHWQKCPGCLRRGTQVKMRKKTFV